MADTMNMAIRKISDTGKLNVFIIKHFTSSLKENSFISRYIWDYSSMEL